MVRGIRAAAILFVGILSGALRDFLFINLNYQIDHVRRATPGSFAHSRFRTWTEGWDLPDLIRLKWMLAAAFVLWMWALSMALLRNAHAVSRLWRPVSLLFGAIALMALVMYGCARWFPLEEAAANLLHAIQYPVLLVVLQIAVLLFPERAANTPATPRR